MDTRCPPNTLGIPNLHFPKCFIFCHVFYPKKVGNYCNFSNFLNVNLTPFSNYLGEKIAKISISKNLMGKAFFFNYFFLFF